jgi:UPF0176 protein
MVTVSSFYRFAEQSEAEVAERLQRLEKLGPELDLLGLIVLATEGCNGTIAGAEAAVTKAEDEIRGWYNELDCKRSCSDVMPFRRWKVDLRPQTVSAGNWAPPTPGRNHLSPEAWHEALQDPSALVLDVRNRYEIEIGAFPGAIDPGTDNFGDFQRFLESTDLPRDRPLLTYCTGGIRCEKALGALEKAGFEKVYQLQGGILSYLEKFPDASFRGECYVFDERVALDQRLQPTERWAHCAHCGTPAHEPQVCSVCQSATKICGACRERGQTTCSKACRSRERRSLTKRS